MKKILSCLLLGLCVYTGPLQAVTCDNLVIKIINNGSTDCVLQHKKLVFGTLVDETELPEILFRGASVQYIVKQREYMQAMLLLTYHCGDDEDIELFSYKPTFFRGHREIYGKIITQRNLNATYKTSYPMCDLLFGRDKPSTITWTLTTEL